MTKMSDKKDDKKAYNPKNPFDLDTPGWMIFEEWKSTVLLLRSHADDHAKLEEDLNRKKKMFQNYTEGLEKLGYDTSECPTALSAQNPYNRDTPEYQLVERWKSIALDLFDLNRRYLNSQSSDVIQASKRDTYAEALRKLGHDPMVHK
jgi:hypothetical protein